MVLSWVACGAAWGILSLLDETALPVGAPVVMLLARWFWARHRYWAAGAAAACAGSVVAFVLTDLARPHLDRITADASATACAATVALVVFTGVSRLASSATRSNLT
ncbi:hypothetical protein ACNPQM_27920 [Streptomyces sp. NPDC056231]|uniref:hypothetical protein n=1 Tax=Streptomyces sp. NPDC056231 TaxID=3345755 RepID=UPI003AAA7A90